MSGNQNRHLSFPFRIGSDGKSVQTSNLAQHIRDEIIQLLLTGPGERVFLPEFGGGLRQLIFGNIDESQIALAKSTLVQRILNWLGHKITLHEPVLTTENETVTLELNYTIKATQETGTIVFQREGIF